MQILNAVYRSSVVKALSAIAMIAVLAGCEVSTPPKVAGSNGATAAPSATPATPRPVDSERIGAADSEPGQWLSHGRTYDEQRFSPLDSIDDGNVTKLGLDWFYDFPTSRGMEATPLFIDGVLYTSTAWSMVYAFDARTGDVLWSYDPKVPRAWMVNVCCDAVNRGVAAWQGRIYVGTLDGRLVALDAKTGTVDWTVQTTPRDKPYSITGAPRVIKGKVIIGNGGGEFGVRGYISAYDANSGDLVWRFYTVPGDPSKPRENPILEQAAQTWHGDVYWKIGGGGTVWDSMAYDPQLDLLYFGVGNGSPWNREHRSPGGGDNLFLSSILAVRPDSGEYVWHYQTTPGESWDYTATQHMILADMLIDGRMRNVIMQAPKNGFFYVLDRASGELLSAEKYTKVNWASHVDLETGRPVETENARYSNGEAALLYPNTQGGHNWHPMSYSPNTGLVYIPAHQGLMSYAHDEDFEYDAAGWNTGLDLLQAVTPEDPDERNEMMAEFTGFITAWDPVRQQEVWRFAHTTLWNGGMLSTAGNLLFQGNADGEFVAYRADTGDRLWAAQAYTGIVAAPISYALDGKQYVAVVAGWGGAQVAFGEIAGRAAGSTVPGGSNFSRLLVFSLDGEAQLPTPEQSPVTPPNPPALAADMDTIEQGHELYIRNCHYCHGDRAISGTNIPDLRYMSRETHGLFDAIVRGGLRHEKGMAGFANRLSADETAAIHSYLIKRAIETKEELKTSHSAMQ